MSRDKLEAAFKANGLALSALRAELKYFLSTKDAETVDIDNMPATDLIKEVHYVLKISRPE